MRKPLVFLCVTAGVFAHSILPAQVTLQKDVRLPAVQPDSTYQLDRWINEESFQVRADTMMLPSDTWTLEPIKGTWYWVAPPEVRQKFDTLYFRYEVWPMDLPVSVYEREMVEFDALDNGDTLEGSEQIIRRQVRKQDLFGDSQLQRSGSLRRGIVVGSAQDFSLESGLRLDVSGHITEEIEVVASLTDRSTPIQPDGTTQTLREFDQVYIRLIHDKGSLQMGDIDMNLQRSDFAVIDRRLQGVGLQTDFDNYGSYQGNAAVARGQYREMQLKGVDGVQGPYRLSGADNEQFIIVLAGSERIYINGRRMVRGEENDYVIDYGLGEITFTSNQIITDHTRITADFQYLRDAYTRTVLAAEAREVTMMDDRVTFGVSVIREADNVNLSTQLFLTDFERETLRNAGDDPLQAVVSGVDSVGFQRDVDFLLYSSLDTLYQGEHYQIFDHIAGDSSGVYRVHFSRVQEGEGDYRRVGRAANGILYEWAGPGLGNYMPERRLSRPKEQSMVALRSAVQATSHINIYGEWAGSYHDYNRLSYLDNQNNTDMSFLAGIAIDPYKTRLGSFGFNMKGRFEGENFSYFDRVREVEFDRRWNVSSLSQAEELRLESSGSWELTPDTRLNLGAGLMDRDNFDGVRGDLHLLSEEDRLPVMDYYLEYIESEDRNLDEKGTWLRQRGRTGYDISLPLGVLEPEFVFEHEDRFQRSRSADSLLPTSFRFVEVGPGLYYRLTEDFRVGSSISYRRDTGVLNNQLTDESYGITQKYLMEYRRGDIFQTNNTLGLRQRRFEELFRLEEQRHDSRGVLIRSVTDYRPWNRFIETQLLYDANTERRPLNQEAFIEVGSEIGQYIWIDTNEDGVQQIDEFFPEQTPNEGSFIKHLVPSEELYPVISLQARWRTTIDPSQLIDPYDTQYSELLDFLSGLHWQSIIDIREENQTQRLEDIYLMRVDKFQDDSLTIRGRMYIEQGLELFRNNPRRELRIIGDRMRSQNRQSSGVEHQSVDNARIIGGGRISRRYRASVSIAMSRNDNFSESFISRNYLISGMVFTPRVDIRWNQPIQTGMGVSYTQRTDRYPAIPSEVVGMSVHADSRIRLGEKISVTVSVEQRRYELKGGPSTSLGEFELTDGAGMGNTTAWSLQSEYRISDFLRASLQYDGRTVTDRPVIQTIRFMVNASF